MTDGTEDGTVLVLDLRTGTQDARPDELVAVGDLVFFQARTEDGHRLFVSAGTAGTTEQLGVTDELGEPHRPIAYDGDLFFWTESGSIGRELWRSDGTEAGTTLVLDIRPGEDGSRPGEPIVADGILYFAANDGSVGSELWQSDGTSAGTTRIADIRPGEDGSNPEDLAALDGAILFAADDGVNGVELWTTDPPILDFVCSLVLHRRRSPPGQPRLPGNGGVLHARGG